MLKMFIKTASNENVTWHRNHQSVEVWKQDYVSHLGHSYVVLHFMFFSLFFCENFWTHLRTILLLPAVTGTIVANSWHTVMAT